MGNPKGLHDLSNLRHLTDDEVRVRGLLAAHQHGDHPQFFGWGEIPNPIVNDEALVPLGTQYLQGALVSLWIRLGDVTQSSHVYDVAEVALDAQDSEHAAGVFRRGVGEYDLLRLDLGEHPV